MGVGSSQLVHSITVLITLVGFFPCRHILIGGQSLCSPSFFNSVKTGLTQHIATLTEKAKRDLMTRPKISVATWPGVAWSVKSACHATLSPPAHIPQPSLIELGAESMQAMLATLCSLMWVKGESRLTSSAPLHREREDKAGKTGFPLPSTSPSY